jgi:hypothetical protein
MCLVCEQDLEWQKASLSTFEELVEELAVFGEFTQRRSLSPRLPSQPSWQRRILFLLPYRADT